MMRGLVYFSLLALVSALALQSRAQTTNHTTEWTVRRAHYADPKIVETASGLTITANDPTPLDRVLIVLANKYDWHINYEDPYYTKADLVDDTEPNWLAAHPNGRRGYVVGGGAFAADISIPGFTPNGVPHAEQVLPALIKAYNNTSNPGRFELRASGNGGFDVVGIAAGDGPQKSILDTIVSFDATSSVSAWETISALCAELTRRSGQPVDFWGSGEPGPDQRLEKRIALHLQDVPAREVLRQLLGQIDANVGWRLLYQADLGRLILELHNPGQPL
jgi:hypothetical protein